MILDPSGRPVSAEPDSEARRGMHTDVFCLPRGASAPRREYKKLMRILERGDVREKLANSEKMKQRKGMYNIYLDTHCGIRKTHQKDVQKKLDAHQDAFADLVEKRANDEKITETQKAYSDSK